MVAVMLALGRVAYDVHVAPEHLTWLIGAAVFSCLGMALAALMPWTEAAPALANVVVLPLYFIFGVFEPVQSLPPWLRQVATALPVKPFVEVMSWPYDPTPTAPWTALGLLSLLAGNR